MKATYTQRYTNGNGVHYHQLHVVGIPSYPIVEDENGNTIIKFMVEDSISHVEIVCSPDEASELGKMLISRAVR